MHKNYTQPKEGLYLDINLHKFLVIIITIMVSLVIPIQLITYSRANAKKNESIEVAQNYTNTTQVNEGQVAGISTARGDENQILGLIENINLKSKPTQYAIMGIFFIGLSLTSLYYLYSTEKNYKSSR